MPSTLSVRSPPLDYHTLTMPDDAASPLPGSSSRTHDPYALEETVSIARPPLPGTVEIGDTVDDIVDSLAADLLIHAENCVREFGDFHLALSGGSTPQPFYRRLILDPLYRRFPWSRTHLWVVDERCVPFEHEHSNYGAISDLICDHADIPPEQVHPIDALSSTADTDYERTLQDTLAWREKGQDRLDYILLGLGADGHTASLFPGTDPLSETSRFIRRNPLSAYPHLDYVKPGVERITMTFPLINSARLIAIMITGPAKAQTIARIIRGEDSLQNLPILGVRPLLGELKWYLDADACPSSVDP